MGGHIRKNKAEARQWGGAFIPALNFDTFDRVFRAYVDGTSSFFWPRSVSVGNFTFAVT